MFGQRLRQLRNEKKLSLRELSKKINLSYSALGKYERGEREPDFHTLEKIADFFNVSLDYLLGRSVSKETVFLNKVQEKYGEADRVKVERLLDELKTVLSSDQLRHTEKDEFVQGIMNIYWEIRKVSDKQPNIKPHIHSDNQQQKTTE